MWSSSASSPLSGLCYLLPFGGSQQPLPLQEVEVDCRVVDLCAEVTVKQTYHVRVDEWSTSSQSPLNCSYVFPLDENSAVCGFSACVDGETRLGVVKAKEEARADFNRAVRAGQTAALLERQAENVFECKLGQLQAGSVCVVTLTYITQLDMEGRCNRLTFPMTIAPKYNPAVPSQYRPTPPPPSAPLTINAVHYGVQCDHCLMSPIIGPRFKCSVCPDFDLCQQCEQRGVDAHDPTHNLLKHNTPTSGMGQVVQPRPVPAVEVQKPQSISVTVHVSLPSPIVQITSPSHPTRITQQSLSPHSATLHYSTPSTSSLDSDLIFLIEQRRAYDPRAMLEVDPTTRTAAVALAFMPPPLAMTAASALPCELVFLIDRSGSMAGSSIAAVRSTMQTLLRSLPTGCRFNIIGFGSHHQSLFPGGGMEYTADSLRKAAAHVENMQADLGGTEIARPLMDVLTAPQLRSQPRQVFLLTDGQVNQVDALVAMVRKEGQGQRLFTFGIGSQVDRSLCKRLAKAGNGQCEFVSVDASMGQTPTADIPTKVMRQLARAMQPTLTEVSVDWGALSHPSAAASTTSAQAFLQCPMSAPAIFAGSRYSLYALNVQLPDSVYDTLAKGDAATSPVDLDFPIHIRAHSNRPGEEGELRLTVDVKGSHLSQGRTVQRLAARARVAELEDLDADGRKRGVVDAELRALALRHSLTTRCTSFVVVFPKRDGASTSSSEVECSEGESVDSSLTDDINTIAANSAWLRAPTSGAMFALSAPSCSFGGGGGMGAYGGGLSGFGAAAPSAAPRMSHQFRASASTAQQGSLRDVVMQSTFGSHGVKVGVDNTARVTSAPAPKSSGSFFSSFFSGSTKSTAAPAAKKESTEWADTSLSWGEGSQSGCAVTSASAAAPSAPADGLGALVQLQHFDGHWTLQEELVKLLSSIASQKSLRTSSPLTLQRVQQLAKAHAVSDDAAATLLCLWLLSTAYAQRASEWQLLSAKSTRWLSTQANVSEQQQTRITQDIQAL